MKRFLLIDGMGLVYRAYFAFVENPLRNTQGLNTTAPFGFLTSILDLYEEFKPTHWAVAWDSDAPTARHDALSAYKAHRAEPPEEMVASLPYIRALCDALQLHQKEVAGYEADDLIALWAKQAEALPDVEKIWVVSMDKDLAQLVSEKIHLYRPARGKSPAQKLDPEGVKAHFGVKPEQIPDYLALVGDASDNLPGVSGIGPTTARKLLAQYSSLEAIYAHLKELPASLMRKLEIEREKAELTYKLVLLRPAANPPAEACLDEAAFQVRPPAWEKLLPLLDELELRKPKERLRRLWKEAAPQVSSHILPQTRYTLIESPEALRQYLQTLPPDAPIAIDTETTSTHPMYAELVGLSLCAKVGEAVFCPITPDTWPAWREVLTPLFRSPRLKIAHNLKYDLVVLRQQGLSVEGPFFDTMLADYVLDPERPHSLEEVAYRELRFRKAFSYPDLFEGMKEKDLRKVPLDKLVPYACQDADLALRLFSPLAQKLKQENLWDLYEQVEIPLLGLLAEMELRGIQVDKAYLLQLNAEYEAELRMLEEQAHRLAEETFNLNSPRQLAEVLYNKLGLPILRRTPTRQPATDEEVLLQLRHLHPLVEVLLRYRELYKLRYTYAEGLLSSIHPQTGRIHTVFQQTSTATGRLSSQNPNLQNIPIRTEDGKRLRKAFVASQEGYVLLSADYSQIELRIAAALAKDAQMIEDFRAGRDIHTTTARSLFGAEEITPEMRRVAKTVNFGIIYGITAHGLVQRLGGGLSRKEAQKLIDQYFAQYPGIYRYIQQQIAWVEQKGYAETLLGRRRYILTIRSQNKAQRSEAERLAINTPIQGTAADMIKLAMVRLAQRLPDFPPLLQIHDELLWEVPAAQAAELAAIIAQEMAQALPLPHGVPVEVEVRIGANWLEMEGLPVQ